MARIPASILRIGVPGENAARGAAADARRLLRTIGYQFEHLSSHQQRIWLREMIETGAHRQPLPSDDRERAPAATG